MPAPLSAPDRAAAVNKPRLLDKWEVEDVTSLDITTIYRKMKSWRLSETAESRSPAGRMAAIGHHCVAGGTGGRHKDVDAPAPSSGCSVVSSGQLATLTKQVLARRTERIVSA